MSLKIVLFFLGFGFFTSSMGQVLNSFQETDSLQELYSYPDTITNWSATKLFLNTNMPSPSGKGFEFLEKEQNHELAFTSEIKRKQKNKNLPFYLFTLLLLGLTLMMNRNPQEIQVFQKATLNYKFALQHFRDHYKPFAFGSIFYNLFFVLVFALFIYLLLRYFGLKIMVKNHTLDLKEILVLIVSIYGVKFIFYQFLGILFNKHKLVNLYLFHVALFNQISGIFLLPVLFVIYFGNAKIASFAMILAAIGLFIFILMRFIRGFQISGKVFSNNKFHFILYLCAFEILPLILLSKFVVF